MYLEIIQVNVLTTNSPSKPGSYVDGTITYVAGGSLSLALTSRMFMKDLDLAVLRVY